jgi:hypothetical protein
MDTTKNSLEIIKEMNPWFGNNVIPPEEFDMLVIGKRVSGAGDESTIRFDLLSDPRADAVEAGVEKGVYLRVLCTRVGGIEASEKKKDVGAKSWRASKRKHPYNIFKNSQEDLYNWIMQSIKDGEYAKLPDTEVQENGKTVKRPVIKLINTIWGKAIGVTVPEYKIMIRGTGGKLVPWTGPKYDPKLDKYNKNTPRVNNILRMFVDEEDLAEVESLAVRQYDRNVRPHTTAKVVNVKTTVEPDKVITEVVTKQEPASSTEELSGEETIEVIE